MAVRRRGSAWTEGETLILLSIWGENRVEDKWENPNANNTRIYRIISAEMTDKVNIPQSNAILECIHWRVLTDSTNVTWREY